MSAASKPGDCNSTSPDHHPCTVCGHYLSGCQRKAVQVHTQCGANTE